MVGCAGGAEQSQVERAVLVVEQLVVDMPVELAVDLRAVAPFVDPSVAFQQQVFESSY